jgi:hypothetical protein
MIGVYPLTDQMRQRIKRRQSEDESDTSGRRVHISALDDAATRRAKDLARFWSKVEKTDGCWLWTGQKFWTGYSVFTVCPAPNVRRSRTGHRWIYETLNGPIPEGMFVLHSCDVRHCVNPAHLGLGPSAENSAQMVERGRHKPISRPGVLQAAAKLTDERVREMRALAASGVRTGELARRFGVSPCNVRVIVNRRGWKHV